MRPLDLLWFLDPMPLPPMASRESTAFYRWLSVVLLQAQQESR